MCQLTKNTLHKVLTEYIQWFVSSRHSGTRQTLALQKHTQKRIWLDTAGLLHWKKHLAANPCPATQRVRARPLSLPLLAPAISTAGLKWTLLWVGGLFQLWSAVPWLHSCRGKIQEAIHWWPACKTTKPSEDDWSLPALLPPLCADSYRLQLL